MTLPEAVINDITAESDSIKGQEPNVPSNYDSDTDFYDYENDSDSGENEYIWKFLYPCILKDVFVLVLMKKLQATLVNPLSLCFSNFFLLNDSILYQVKDEKLIVVVQMFKHLNCLCLAKRSNEI